MVSPGRSNSLETIVTFENADGLNEWSAIWSTTHIPGMDNATGIGSGRRLVKGRRNLRIGSLAMAMCLTTHCRVAASAVSGGYVVFMILFVIAVMMLANPLRHFEVYLGQWSISGPGRAFRMTPMLDGIGIAISINAIVRAIVCCAIAAMAAIYVTYSVADAELPFTYCRNFDLENYTPAPKQNELKQKILRHALGGNASEFRNTRVRKSINECGQNSNMRKYRRSNVPIGRAASIQKIKECNETYPEKYPSFYKSPAHNFFYVELMRLRPDYSFADFNVKLILSIIGVWLIMWLLMISERLKYGRLIWNNIRPYFVAVPVIWALLLFATVILHIVTGNGSLPRVFRFGVKETLVTLGDAIEVALYVHSAGMGTELIHGKGLNHYASGHIDSQLNSDNVLHSGLIIALVAAHTAAASICSFVDDIQADYKKAFAIAESTFWVMPMYSKCILVGPYKHFMSTLLFSGLMFTHLMAAFVLLKTALHTIFEYRVKLVFIEQYIVAMLIITCMGLSIPFATSGGVPLLESVDAMTCGVCVPTVVLLQLVALLYVYRSRDFKSDMKLATEDNSCSTRISTQWRIIPALVLAFLILKIVLLTRSEMPLKSMLIALTPVFCVILAIPLRALHNYFVFLRPAPRHGT